MASFALTRLINRKILKISGPDCYPYLQGLLCNDLRHLYEPENIPKRKHARSSSSVLSTFMLNAQGQATEPDELLIECDSGLASGLANTLYGYRVRRKITLSSEDQLSVWCLFPTYNSNKSELTLTGQDELIDTSSIETNEILSDELTVVSDPRITSMGLRIITKNRDFNEVKRSIQTLINVDITKASNNDYTLFRYLLGIGEGVNDHPESNCLPLECNADLLGSVSFTKGCYLGQELTARIHYTGVVRKRLMPIILDHESRKTKPGNIPLVSGTDIIDEITKKKIGILRHVVENRALALLRHELVSGSDHQLIHDGSNTKISTYVPFWWNLT